MAQAVLAQSLSGLGFCNLLSGSMQFEVLGPASSGVMFVFVEVDSGSEQLVADTRAVEPVKGDLQRSLARAVEPDKGDLLRADGLRS